MGFFDDYFLEKKKFFSTIKFIILKCLENKGVNLDEENNFFDFKFPFNNFSFLVVSVFKDKIYLGVEKKNSNEPVYIMVLKKNSSNVWDFKLFYNNYSFKDLSDLFFVLKNFCFLDEEYFIILSVKAKFLDDYFKNFFKKENKIERMIINEKRR